MIIRFSKNIELSDWYAHGGLYDLNWHRDDNLNYDAPQALVQLRRYDQNNGAKPSCYVYFYGPLSFLHNYFPDEIDGDLQFSKNYVDKWLIKMSRLLAFI